jgi:hypothetical protein
MALMSSIIDSESSNVQEAANQQVRWNAMVNDDVWDIVPGPEDSQFQVALPKVPSSLRGSVDVCSIRQVLSHRFKCLDMWKSPKAFNLGNLL